jgi:hypothetical protein
MPQSRRRAITNEARHPYIVEVAVVGDGLDVQLSRQIMHFHRSRNIEPRCGRRTAASRKRYYFCWCFSDLLIALAFIEQFGGELFKYGI